MPTDANLSLASAEPALERPVASSPLGAGHTTGRRRPNNERVALGFLALAAIAIVIWLASPVAIGVFMGSLLAFTMESFHQRLIAQRFRPWLAALTSTSVATLGVITVAGAMGYLIVSRGLAVAANLLESLGPDGSARAFILRTSARFPRQLSADFLIDKLSGAAADLTARAGLIAGAVVHATVGALLGSVFMVLTIYFVLRHWPLLVRRAEELLPLHPRHTRALLEEYRTAGRITLLGTVVTGLVQGVLAYIGYGILGVPEPAFLGAATAVASLLPVVGTVLVWLPAGVYLIATGAVGRGVFELAYGLVVVVGISDYFIRPRLVRGEGKMPVLLVLIALFGGLELFGIVGLILGPVLMDLARATLRLYAAEKRKGSPVVGRHG